MRNLKITRLTAAALAAFSLIAAAPNLFAQFQPPGSLGALIS